MKKRCHKRIVLFLMGIMWTFSSFAAVSPEVLQKCMQVELFGAKSGESIKILALDGNEPAAKGVAFVKIPGMDTNVVKSFKYLVDGYEEGCFGVVEKFYINGESYSNVVLVISYDISRSGVANVEYSVFKGDDTIYEGNFAFYEAKFSNPVSNNAKDRDGYKVTDRSAMFKDFAKWLRLRVEEYTE